MILIPPQALNFVFADCVFVRRHPNSVDSALAGEVLGEIRSFNSCSNAAILSAEIK